MSRKGWVGMCALGIVAIAASAAPTARAGAIVAGFDDHKLEAGQMGMLASVGFEINFFGYRPWMYGADKVFVGRDGLLSFDEPVEWRLWPNVNDIVSQGKGMIAPFFAPVDISGEGNGVITYGVGTYMNRQAFGATWTDVKPVQASMHQERNSFQVLLVNRSDTGEGNFDIVFNYDKIEWMIASINAFGLVYAGYANGSFEPGSYYLIPGSGEPESFLDSNPNGLVHRGSGNDFQRGGAPSTPGRFTFAVRNDGATPAVPEPASLTMAGAAALAGLSLACRRKRLKARA